MRGHPDAAEIRAWLETGHSAPALEAHLARCGPCAARLEEEARMEEALFEVAEAKPRARPSAAGWALAIVAAAASILLLLGTVTAERTSPSAPPHVDARALDGGVPRDGSVDP